MHTDLPEVGVNAEQRRCFPLIPQSNGFWELCQVHYGLDVTLEVLATITLFPIL